MKQLALDFESKILKFSEQHHVDYLNMMAFRLNYTFTDGYHLGRASGKAFSKYLAEQINELRE
ncbi:MAG TPA: hypothetical protein VIN72_00045 [Lutibacter sp.]